jgi:hypothetical protein
MGILDKLYPCGFRQLSEEAVRGPKKIVLFVKEDHHEKEF